MSAQLRLCFLSAEGLSGRGGGTLSPHTVFTAVCIMNNVKEGLLPFSSVAVKYWRQIWTGSLTVVEHCTSDLSSSVSTSTSPGPLLHPFIQSFFFFFYIQSEVHNCFGVVKSPRCLFTERRLWVSGDLSVSPHLLNPSVFTRQKTQPWEYAQENVQLSHFHQLEHRWRKK